MINGKWAPRSQAKAPNELKEFKITNIMVAKWFKYLNARSFNSSSAKDDILKGVKEVIKHVKNQCILPDK